MPVQEQFLEVIDRDEAQRRFHAALHLRPLGSETLPLAEALGRVLAENVASGVDVPSFDRSNVDGFAVRAADTFGAREEAPGLLRLLPEVAAMGVVPQTEVLSGTALATATGGMLPRGADAVVMVEHAEVDADTLLVQKSVTPGSNVSFAGTDIAAGETVLRRGQRLTSRETGVLAAIGRAHVQVWRRPRVAVVSTGNELIPPGEPMRPGMVYDSNARILCDALRELGCESVPLGIVRDDADQLRRVLREAIGYDAVLLSGGTSKGAGDLCYRVVAELQSPGIVAHGVALKPGKPICLAVERGKPVVVLPGFPTSAIFTFHEFVAPVLRILGGQSIAPTSHAGEGSRQSLPAAAGGPHFRRARLAVKVNSEIGRTEYLLVGLVEAEGELVAYPMGKGSGSVTTFSTADGFVTIGRHEEIVEAGTIVAVQLLAPDLRLADLVAIGSHCVGLDYLLTRLHEAGFSTRFLAVGSMAGLAAAQRGECDVAGMHLLDPATGEYNRPFLTADLQLVPGYQRQQGIVFRRGDVRFEGRSLAEVSAAVRADPACIMVNRNPASGTRVLIDRLLAGAQPSGYAIQPRSHNAVAAAVAQGRADWGVAIEYVARLQNLGFLPLAAEQYDFAIPRRRFERPAVQAFVELLGKADVREELARRGCEVAGNAPSK